MQWRTGPIRIKELGHFAVGPAVLYEFGPYVNFTQKSKETPPGRVLDNNV